MQKVPGGGPGAQWFMQQQQQQGQQLPSAQQLQQQTHPQQQQQQQQPGMVVQGTDINQVGRVLTFFEFFSFRLNLFYDLFQSNFVLI